MPVRTDHESRTPRLLATGLLLVMVCAAIAGCGSSHTTGTAADPAGVIPASAPLYAGAVVRPGGSLRTAALAAGRTLTHQANAYLRLLGALQTPGSAPLDFNRDVSSWLGPRAGIFLSSLDGSGESKIGQLLSMLAHDLLGGSSTANVFPFAGHGVQGAIVLDTRDAAQARSFLYSQATRAAAHAASYRGVAYRVTPEGAAFAVVDRFAVIGSEDGLHSVIDTTLGGSSLAQAAGYAKLLALAPSGALAHVYVNPGAHGSAGLLGLLAGTRETNISLVPSTTSIALDADALSSGSSHASGGLLASGAQGASAAGELPGESWLALGLGDVGATLGSDVQGLRALASLGSSLGGSGTEGPASGALSLKSLLEGILTPLSVLGANSAEARRDFQSWMGSAGIFASGSGLAELRAGIVIASTNPTLSRAAVPKLAALLRKAGGSVQPVSIPGAESAVAVYLTGLPITLDVVDARAANGQTKFVIGLGETSVAAALAPSSTLSGAASFSAASTALGGGARPSLTVDFPTLLSLLEAVGLSEDPTISKLVPYLRTLTTLAGGGVSLGGGVERFHLVLGLQQTG